jgi:transcriptional regulator with XRE-family HTH domain
MEGRRTTWSTSASTDRFAGGRRDAVVLLREEIGDVLRDARRQQGRTLREVSSVARVSLGYLSEVERGQKEASSELLASICGALEVPLSLVLREVSERVAATEQSVVDSVVAAATVPDVVPEDLAVKIGLVSAA